MFLMVQQLCCIYNLLYLLLIAAGLMMESTFHVRFIYAYSYNPSAILQVVMEMLLLVYLEEITH